jgi:hypothetical protein
MSAETALWWTGLRAVAALNLVLWAAAAVWLWRRGDDSPQARADRRLQLLLSLGYVIGCAYRSVFPVYDVPRLVMVDSWLSSVAVGRSVATVAELCFAAQWALLLRRAAGRLGHGPGVAIARLLVPLIAIAEACSWHAVLTTSNLGHVLEETIWATCAALLGSALWSLRPHARPDLRPWFGVVATAAAAYVAYMLAVDVPMYWARWLADEAHGRAYLELSSGLVDVATRWTPTQRWSDWRSEVVWMSLYFSAAVWLSIALVYAPHAAAARAALSPRSGARAVAAPRHRGA